MQGGALAAQPLQQRVESSSVHGVGGAHHLEALQRGQLHRGLHLELHVEVQVAAVAVVVDVLHLRPGVMGLSP